MNNDAMSFSYPAGISLPKVNNEALEQGVKYVQVKVKVNYC